MPCHFGRALRSKEDRALFVLADERYGKTQHFNLLPEFVQDRASTVTFSEVKGKCMKLGIR